MNRPFFDTSILVAGMIDFGESSQAPIRILDLVADGAIGQASSAWHCCLEFFSVTTRLPEEYRLSPTTAAEFIEEEIIQTLGIRILNSSNDTTLFTQADRNRIAGGRIYDFHIGATAVKSDTTVIVTENKKHFLYFESTDRPVYNAIEFLNKLDS